MTSQRRSSEDAAVLPWGPSAMTFRRADQAATVTTGRQTCATVPLAKGVVVNGSRRIGSLPL